MSSVYGESIVLHCAFALTENGPNRINYFSLETGRSTYAHNTKLPQSHIIPFRVYIIKIIPIT